MLRLVPFARRTWVWPGKLLVEQDFDPRTAGSNSSSSSSPCIGVFAGDFEPTDERPQLGEPKPRAPADVSDSAMYQEDDVPGTARAANAMPFGHDPISPQICQTHAASPPDLVLSDNGEICPSTTPPRLARSSASKWWVLKEIGAA
jgi:hypothetical protein